MSLARGLTAGRAVVVVVVVHDLNLAARYADVVALLKDGELIGYGTFGRSPTLEEVFEQLLLVLP